MGKGGYGGGCLACGGGYSGSIGGYGSRGGYGRGSMGIGGYGASSRSYGSGSGGYGNQKLGYKGPIKYNPTMQAYAAMIEEEQRRQKEKEDELNFRRLLRYNSSNNLIQYKDENKFQSGLMNATQPVFSPSKLPANPILQFIPVSPIIYSPPINQTIPQKIY